MTFNSNELRLQAITKLLAIASKENIKPVNIEKLKHERDDLLKEYTVINGGWG